MAGVSDPSVSGYFAPLTDSVPSWAPVTRGAGSWSRQTAPAVDGTTFLELGTAQNTGRFDYSPVGRSMLLLEPTRTNKAHRSNFVDVAPADGTPDGWVIVAGTTAVDFDTVAGGPHGGRVFRLLDTAVVTRGVYVVGVLAAATQYAYSVWTRRTAAGAAELFTTDGALNGTIALPEGPYDWRRDQVLRTPGGAGGTLIGMCAAAGTDPPGIVSLGLVQVEAGDCATSVIPTVAAADVSRAAELCTVDTTVVGRTSGHVSFLWRPDFANDAALTANPVLFAWAPNWELYYDVADDKLKVLADGAAGAESAALTFSRQALFRVSVRYGAAGTQLTVDQSGVGAATTTDPSAWGTPALACYLGSRAASANCRPAAYGDLLLAA